MVDSEFGAAFLVPQSPSPPVSPSPHLPIPHPHFPNSAHDTCENPYRGEWI